MFKQKYKKITVLIVGLAFTALVQADWTNFTNIFSGKSDDPLDVTIPNSSNSLLICSSLERANIGFVTDSERLARQLELKNRMRQQYYNQNSSASTPLKDAEKKYFTNLARKSSFFKQLTGEFCDTKENKSAWADVCTLESTGEVLTPAQCDLIDADDKVLAVNSYITCVPNDAQKRELNNQILKKSNFLFGVGGYYMNSGGVPVSPVNDQISALQKILADGTIKVKIAHKDICDDPEAQKAACTFISGGLPVVNNVIDQDTKYQFTPTSCTVKK